MSHFQNHPIPKVVRIISGLWPGGVEKKLTALLPRLKELGADVSVICLREEGELAPILKDQGIDVVVSRMPSRWSPVGLRNLIRQLKTLSVDIVHTHMYRSNVSGVVAAKLAGTPVVISNIHNVDSWDDRRQLVTDRIISRWRDTTVCVSRGVADDYCQKVRIPEDKLKIIYNGVDTEEYCPGSSSMMTHDGIVIGAAARIMPQKGLDYLVRAASDKEFIDRNVKFYLAGDGPLREDLMKMVEETGASEHFCFLGYVSEIREFYRSLDILAMPSHKEGFSNALVEAMACGIPPVATNVGGNAEAIRTGHSGIIVPPGDYRAFRCALMELVRDHDTRTSMAINARKAAENYSLDNMAKQTMDMYLTLLSQKREDV